MGQTHGFFFGVNQMSDTMHKPIVITPNFYQLGTPSFPAYLSMGEVGMIIEGGTGPRSVSL
jgi:hypothetical protein